MGTQGKTYVADILEQESARKDALSRLDAQKYYTLCATLGIRDIEDPDLYDLGAFESNTAAGALFDPEQVLEGSMKKDERTPNKKYHHFLDDARRYNPKSFTEDTQAKRAMLIRYFPKRFGEGGPQDFKKKDYSAMQIGSIFNGLVRYAQSRLEKEVLA